MYACTEGPENAVFSHLTPGGNLSITIANEADALRLFEQGKDYYLDFTVASNK